MKNLKNFLTENSDKSSEKTDKIKGGLSDDKTLKDIAKKHGVELKKIKNEFILGIKVEMEHTDDSEIASEIAKDHLMEIPDYYSKLSTIENDSEDDTGDKDETIEIVVDLHIDDLPEVDESYVGIQRTLITKKQKNSGKVLREVQKELFGENGSQRDIVNRLFNIFKISIKRKASEMKVPIGHVKNWKIVLRDKD